MLPHVPPERQLAYRPCDTDGVRAEDDVLPAAGHDRLKVQGIGEAPAEGHEEERGAHEPDATRPRVPRCAGDARSTHEEHQTQATRYLQRDARPAQAQQPSQPG